MLLKGVTSYLRSCRWLHALLVATLVGVLHLALAKIYIDHPPQYDEMYHMLAAQSWRETGNLSILDGEYTRASGYTKMVAWQAYVCGLSIECARSLSIAASALMVFSVAIFVSIVMNCKVGAIAGLLLGMNPAVVVASQMVRFYSLHALVFCWFAFALYILLTYWQRMHLRDRSLLGGVVLILLLIANHLQKTTQIGLLGISMAVTLISAPVVYRWIRQQTVIMIGASIIGAASLFLIVIYLIDIQAKVEMFRWTPGWAEGVENIYLYYHWRVRNWYPALWPLAAFFTLLSITRWPRLSIYCLTTFIVCFVLLSIAGVKANRFIVFSLQFLLIPLAGGMYMAVEMAAGTVSHSLKRFLPMPQNQGAIQILLAVIIIGATLWYISTQPLVRASQRMVFRTGYEDTFGHYGYYADWSTATDTLRSLVKEYPTVLSSSGVKAAWYLGNFDFELNYSIMLETDTGDEFGLDRRTGRRVVSTPESIMKILKQYRALLVIVEGGHANDYKQVSTEVVELLDRKGNRIDTEARNLIIWIIQYTPVESETPPV